MLPEALIKGDRDATIRSVERVIDRLSVTDPTWFLSAHLGMLAAARADAMAVSTLGDVVSWAERLVEHVRAIRVRRAEGDLPFASRIAESRKTVEERAETCRALVHDTAKGAWTEPGSLVRSICLLGEFHLAREVAELLTAHGDGSAGRNVRASLIRGLDTMEAVRLTADIVARNPSHYAFNTRSGSLMDAFVATGDTDFLDDARKCLCESIRMTPIEYRPASYTFAALSRHVRVIDDQGGRDIGELAEVASGFDKWGTVHCLPSCECSTGGLCNCPKKIDELWRGVATILKRAGLASLCEAVRSREPDIAKAVVRHDARPVVSAHRNSREYAAPRRDDLELDPF